MSALVVRRTLAVLVVTSMILVLAMSTSDLRITFHGLMIASGLTFA